MNWSEAGNWETGNGTIWVPATTYPGQVAGTGDVTIQDGHTVTIDVSPVHPITRLLVGEGTSGVLQYEEAIAQILTVDGIVTINQNAVFRSALTGTVTTHQLITDGSIVNNGTINFSTNNDAAGVGITFTGTGSFNNEVLDLRDATLTNLRAANGLLLDKGTNVLSFLPGGIFQVQSANTVGFLTIQSGTFSLMGENLFSNPLFYATTGNYTIPPTGGFWLDNPRATITGIYGTLTNDGELIIKRGVFNLGNGTGNELLTTSTGSFVMSGDILNISGRFRVDGGSCVISGGTINLATIGHANQARAAFYTSGPASLTISGNPLITFGFPNTNTDTHYDDIEIVAGTGVKTITDGTFQMGTGTPSTDRTFLVNSDIPLHNLKVNSAHIRVSLTDHLTVNNLLSLDGRLLLNNFNLNLGAAAAILGDLRTSHGMIRTGEGQIHKTINSTGTYLFPFGDSSDTYLPVTLNFTGGSFTSGATVSVGIFNSKHPENVNTTNYLKRYWTVRTTGIANPIYDFSGKYDLADDVVGSDGFMRTGIYTTSWQKTDRPVDYTLTSKGLTGDVDISGITAAPPVVTINNGPTAEICYGRTVNLTATVSGDSPLVYAWTPTTGLSTSTSLTTIATPTVTTTYRITATDGNNDTAFDEITITVNLLPTLTSMKDDVSCFGGNNGTISAVATNGTTPYSYVISGPTINTTGAATGVFTGLTTGEYTITVNDANGCTSTTSQTITQPTALTATGGQVNAVSCFGGNNGSAIVTPSGGTQPYNISPAQTGLSAGNHTFTVTDANGCTTTVNVTITQPAQLTATGVQSNAVSCFGGNNGSATVTPSGGTAPYTITPVQTGLSAGNHTFTVTDANGCTATVDVAINQPTVLTATGVQANAVSCFGGNNGAATITPTGGTAPYTISPAQTGLSAGNHTFTVTDANGCTSTANVTITQPAVLTATGVQANAVSCFGGNNGSATVTPSGGIAPYTITPVQTGLSAGIHTFTVTDANGCTATAIVTITQPAQLTATGVQTNAVSCFGGNNGSATVTPSGGTAPYTITPVQTGLSAGNHTFTVTDANGCTATVDVAINQPTVLTATGVQANAVSCFGGNNGAATITPTGGTAPYTISPAQTGLSAGNHTFTVTDANGCTSTANVTITQPSQLTATGVQANAVSCFGGNNGAATITPSGGTSPYTITPAQTGLSAGIHTFTVTDANGCTSTANVTITQPTVLTATSSSNSPICQGSALSLFATPSGGTTGYTYSWTGPNGFTSTQQNPTIVNVPLAAAGNYTVTVTDYYGCQAIAITTITVNPTPTVNAIADRILCNNTTAAGITLSGPVAGTTFTWTNSNTAIGLAASGSGNIPQFQAINGTNGTLEGIITVTPTANGCVGTPLIFTITVNPTPTVNAIANRILCNNTTAPEITLSGPVAGTTFTWTNSNPAIGLAASGSGNIPSFLPTNGTNGPISGSVAVTPTANGCVGTPLTFTITINPTPTVNAIADRTLCNNTTAAEITLSGPVGGTTFTWTNSNPAIGLAASGSGNIPQFQAMNGTNGTLEGIITVSPTANGCVGTPLIFILTVNPTLTASIAGSTTVCQNDDSPNITFTNPMSVPVTITYRRNSIIHTINVAASSTNTVGVPTITAGTYTYELVTVAYQSNPTCPNNITGSAVVIVNPKANAVPTPSTQTICSGLSITPIVLTSSTTGVTYNWTRNNTTTVTGMTDSGSGHISGSLINTTSSPVTVTFTITANIGGCVGTPEIATVTVYPTPVATVVPAAQTRCSGEAISSIVPGSTTGNTTFTWTRDRVTEVTGLPASGTGPVPTVSLTNTTNSSVTVTFVFIPTANNCIGSPITATVLMNPKGSIRNLTASICNSGSFNVSPINGADGVVAPGTIYSWGIQSATGGITGAVAGSGSIISGTLGNSTNFTQSVTYAVTPTNDGCVGELFLLTVTVTPEPAINTIDRNVCSGNTFTVSPVNGTDGIVPTGTTYSWSAPTGGVSGGEAGSGSSITGTLVNSTLTSQTATYTVTPVSGTCTGNPFTLTVTVNPVAAVTPMTASVCSGESFTVTPVNGTNGTVPSGTTYSWSAPAVTGGVTGGGAGSGAQGINGTLTNPTSSVQTATYTVTPSSGGCAGATFTVTVTVNPKPAVNPMNTTICSGGSFNLIPVDATNGSVPAGTTYSWAAPDVTGITGTASGTDVSSISGQLYNTSGTARNVTYTVTPNAGTCAGTSFSVVVTVNPAPSVNNMDATVCSGTGFTITPVNGTNGTIPPGTTYSWSAPTVPAGITGGAAGSGTNISGLLTNSTNTAQTITYVITPSSGSCTGNAFNLNVTVNPVPSVTISGDAEVCYGGTAPIITFTNQVNLPVTVTYTINSGANFTVDIAASDTTPISATVNQEGIFVYNVVSVAYRTGPTCSTPVTGTTATITVKPITTVVISRTPSGTICFGDPVTFTSNVANAGTNPGYQWYVNDVAVSGATAISYTSTTLNNADKVQLIVTTTDTPCPGAIRSNEITMTVNPSVTPSVTIYESANPICTGTSVTFTANPPVNGGTAPFYQWQLNGSNVGGNSSTYTTSSLVNGDQVRVILTSNAVCAVNPATSNTVTMTVNPNLPVSVSVAASANSVCAGTPVTFTATPTNGGATPVYQWKVNGANVGSNSSTYSYTPANNDVVTVVLTSNAICAAGNPATSTPVTMIVNPNMPVSVTVAASANPVCAGTPVTFTASPTNGGTTPAYQWKVNGVDAGTNSNTYSYTPANNDLVTVVLTSSATCATGSPATSAPLTMTVNPNLPVSVTVAASANSVCAGTPVTFTATPTNGGTTPVYQWKVNDVNVGSNSNTYSYTPVNNDVVTVVLTSNVACATGSPATSAPVTMTVNPNLTVSVTVAASANPVCAGTPVTFTATATNGGTTPSYQWKVNNLNVGSNSSTYSYTPANNDVVTVVLTSSATCATGNPATSNVVTVSPGIPATPGAISGTSDVCIGTTGLTYSISAVPNATSYTWTVPSGWTITAGGTTNSITVSAGAGAISGNITVTATNLCGTSNASTRAVVASTATPARPLAPTGTLSFCPPANGLVFTVTPVPGATSYIWSVLPTGWTIVSGDGTNSITVNVGSTAVAGTRTISVRASNACGTSIASPNLPIIVNTFPYVDAGPDIFVCAGIPNVNYTSPPGGATSGNNDVQWTSSSNAPKGNFTNNGTKADGTYTFTAADIANGSVTLTITSAPEGACNPAFVTDQVLVTIIPNPTVNAGGPDVVCQSATPSAIALTGASVGGGGGLTTGAWSIISGGGSLSSTAQTATPATVTYTPAANFSGTVTLRLTTNAPGGCAARAADRTITVNPVPTVNAGSPDVVCQSATPSAITLTGASVGGGATTGTWSVTTGGGTLSNSTSQNNAGIASTTYTPAANFSGTVTLTLTANAVAGCSAVSATRTITVNPAPTVNAGGPDMACQSASPSAITLSGATVGGGATTGAWSIVSGGGSLSSTAQTATPATVNYTPGANFSGTATLRLTTNTPGGCAAVTADRTITVNPVPTVNAGSPDVVCQSAIPSAITLSGATLGGGATTGTWSITSGGGTLSNTSPTAMPGTITYTPDANFSGIVTLTLTTNASGTCSAVSATRTITVNAAPTVNAGGPDVVCQSATPSAITLTGANIGGGATTGAWSISAGGGTLSSTAQTATPATVTYTPATNFSGIVTLTLTTNASSGCSAVSATRTITVNPAPTVGAGSAQTICSGSAVTLAGSISGGATTGTWTGGGGTFNPDRNTLNASYTPSGAEIAAGTVTLTLTTTNHPATCGPVSSSTTITINKAVVITTQPANTGACVGESAVLSVAADGTNLTYQWYEGTAPGTPISGATSSTLNFNSVSLTDIGSYYVVVTGESPCSPVPSNTITLNVDAAITITSQPANQTRCVGDNVTFSVAADAGGAPLTYQWRKNGVELSGAILSTYTITGITSVADAGSYDVVVGSAAGFNCSSVTSTVATLNVNENGTILLTGNDDQTVCADHSITAITYTIGGSSTGAELTGFLPDGVTHSFSGGVFTISGTPTEQGTFDYTVTATGSPCVNPSLSGTITVEGVGTISLGGGTATPTVCINNPISTITYSIGGNATGAVISSGSLPTGVTGVYANGLYTISGTPTTAGTYPFTVSTTGSACGNPSITGTITVNDNATIALTSASAAQILCIGSPISPISYTSGGSATGIVLTGQLPAGVTGSTSGNVFTISGTPTATGNFNYTVTTTGPCSNTSLSGVIQIDNLADVGYLSPAVSTVCTTTNSGTLRLESYSGNIIQWESSTDGGNTWTIHPVTTNTFTYTNLPNTTLFTALVGNGNCPALYSGIARVTVIPAFTPTITVSGGDVCSGEPVTLTGTAVILPETTGVITGGDFNHSNPKGWRVTKDGVVLSPFPASNNNENQNPWALTNGPKEFCGTIYDSPDRKFSVVSGPFVSTMETPVFSLVAMSSAELSFTHAYNLSAGATAQVELSTDGGDTYSIVLAHYSGTLTSGNPNVVNPVDVDLSPYLGMSNLRIRFNYQSTTCSSWAVEGITLPSPQPDVDYAWGPTELIPGGSGSTVVVLPPTTTTYTLTVWIAGCPGVADGVIVSVVNNPEVYTTDACIGGGDVTFSQSTVYGGTWSVTGGGTITQGGVFTPTTPGCFEATFTTSSGACSGTASFVVYPTAPTPVVNAGCGPIVVTPPPAIYGFNVQYSFDNGATWGANTPPTEENCNGYYIKTRYVTATVCGTTLVGIPSSNTICNESPATVRRIDYSDPTFTVPADITIYKDAVCNYNASTTVTGDVTDERDNCTDVLNATYTDLPVPGACEDELIIERTWLLADDCGNQNVQIQRITVSDNTPPVISPLAADNQSDCSAGNPNADPSYQAWLSSRGGAAATDNCDQLLTWSDNSATQSWSGIAGNSQITITWFATDNCGNTAETTATYSIADTDPPTVVCPASISETALSNNCGKILVTPSDPTINDNCSDPVLSYTLSGATTVTTPVVGTVAGVTFNVGVTTVTYIATDAAGNESEPCSFTVTILDITPPNLTIGGCVNVSESAAANNCSKIPVTIIDPTYSDDCWPHDQLTLSWTMNGATTGSGNGSVVGQTFNVGVTTVTYEVEDPDGNTATCSFTVTILDVTPPNLTIGGCVNVSESAAADNCSTIPVTIIDPTYSDDCWPHAQLTLSWTMNGATTGSGNGSVVGRTFNVGITTVTYEVEDPDGNTATCSFTVTILRLDIPEAAITCPASPAPVTAVAGTCFAPVTVAPPVEVDPCETVTYTFVNDFNHTDNASGDYPVGSTLVTWTITDNSGRTTTCEQTVVVNDLPPTITCPGPVVAQADFELPYQDAVVVPAPTYADNCPNPILTWTLVPPAAYASEYVPAELSGSGIYPSSMFYVGVTTITYTVTDSNGTPVSCSFTVTILEDPEITCLGPVTYDTDPGLCTATRNSDDYGLPTLDRGLQPITWTWTITNPNGTQGATGTFIGSSATPGPPFIPDYVFQQGASILTWRAQNVSGFDECTQTITVIDNQPPTFTLPEPLTECVERLSTAVYDPATIDILPVRPDYYILEAGSEVLDITGLTDNCCTVGSMTIHWRIDLSGGGNITGTGQPSAYGSEIRLPGDVAPYDDVLEHFISFWIEDCNHNLFPEQTQIIKIQPRPNLTKGN